MVEVTLVIPVMAGSLAMLEARLITPAVLVATVEVLLAVITGAPQASYLEVLLLQAGKFLPFLKSLLFHCHFLDDGLGDWILSRLISSKTFLFVACHFYDGQLDELIGSRFAFTKGVMRLPHARG